MSKTIAENLDLLQSTKTRIKDAITNTFSVDPGDEYAKYPEYIGWGTTPGDSEVKTLASGKTDYINNTSVIPKVVKVMVKYEDMEKLTKNFTDYDYALFIGTDDFGMNNIVHKYKVEGEDNPRTIAFLDMRQVSSGWGGLFPSKNTIEGYANAYTEVLDGDKYFVGYIIVPMDNSLFLNPFCDIRYSLVKYEGWMNDAANIPENQLPVNKPNVFVCKTPSGKTLINNFGPRIRLYQVTLYSEKSNNNGTTTVIKNYTAVLGTSMGNHQTRYIFGPMTSPGWNINDKRYDKTNKTFTLTLTKKVLSRPWFIWSPGSQMNAAWNYQTKQTEETMAQNPFLNGTWKMVSDNAKTTYNDDGSVTLVWNNVEFDGDNTFVDLFTGTIIK